MYFSIHSNSKAFFVIFIFSGFGASGDAKIYNESEIAEAVQNGTIGFPDPDLLLQDDQYIPYFFIGVDAFSLNKNFQKPYGHRGLTREERIFNYRLSRARRISENAFGILANRFQVNITTKKIIGLFKHKKSSKISISIAILQYIIFY